MYTCNNQQVIVPIQTAFSSLRFKCSAGLVKSEVSCVQQFPIDFIVKSLCSFRNKLFYLIKFNFFILGDIFCEAFYEETYHLGIQNISLAVLGII